MVKKNYTSWLIMLLISALLLSLTACGSKKGPKNAEEASAMHKDLMAQENAILSKNTQLWDKVFMAADKGMAMIEDGKNYPCRNDCTGPPEGSPGSPQPAVWYFPFCWNK